MTRLEIPALYRLDLGSSKWGWHKMSDLVEAVDQLIYRMPDEFLPPLKIRLPASQKIIDLHKGKRLLEQYGHLNNEPLMAWSDESQIGFNSIDQVPWDRPNLFIPAQWSMDVIDSVKAHATSLDVWTIFDNHATNCLNERERRVLSLRLGKETGKRENLKFVSDVIQVTCERVRTIEAKAMRKLQHCALSSIPVQSLMQQTELAQHISDSFLLQNIPGLTVRVSNAFYNAQIETVGGLKQKSLEDMLKIRNLGKRGARFISDRMLSLGVNLGWFE